MKYLLSFTATFLMAFSAVAASPDYKSFRGTGIILITSNPPTGTIVIDNQTYVITNGQSTPVSISSSLTAQSLSATQLNLTGLGPGNITLGTNVSNEGTQNPSFVTRSTNSAGQEVLFRRRWTNSTETLDSSVNGAAYGSRWEIGSDGSLNIYSGTTLRYTLAASGIMTLNAAAAITFTTRGSVAYDGDGVLTLYNNATTGYNRQNFGGTTAAFPALGRTNGHLKVFGGNGLFGSANTNALYIDGGSYYVSNTIIPSVTQLLGAGGYWVGNSNGFLVTIYTLDGSTTAMKVLAP